MVPPGQQRAGPTGPRERVLVVDDEYGFRFLLHRALTRAGYDVALAASGEEAVDYVRGTSPDLLVLDMIMDPGIDGKETYRRVLEIRPGQRALIASGFSETDRVLEAQQLGAGQYLKKPYTLERLALAVKQSLRE